MTRSTANIKDRFPLTLPLLLFDGFAFITLPFLSLSINTTPTVSATAIIALTMLLTGFVFVTATSFVFTKGTDLIRPDNPFLSYTPGQVALIIGGFALVGFLQLYVNQAFIGSVLSLSTLTTNYLASQQAIVFAADIAIAEEALFGAITILTYIGLVYIGLERIIAAALTLPFVGVLFQEFHTYVYGTTPAALLFTFGARLVLSGVLLGTLAYSRHTDGKFTRSASLVAPVILHVTWNVATF